MDSKEIKTWQDKANRNLGDMGNKTTGKPWSASLWGCFTPIDVCEFVHYRHLGVHSKI